MSSKDNNFKNQSSNSRSKSTGQEWAQEYKYYPKSQHKYTNSSHEFYKRANRRRVNQEDFSHQNENKHQKYIRQRFLILLLCSIFYLCFDSVLFWKKTKWLIILDKNVILYINLMFQNTRLELFILMCSAFFFRSASWSPNGEFFNQKKMMNLPNIQLLCCSKTGLIFATNSSPYFTTQKCFRYELFFSLIL